jgi:DNA-binding SARP family transcriptional activator
MPRLSLGTAQLEQDGRFLTLERKTAGVLALCALEGAQSRAKLAQWFWGDAFAGRNNLRQALFKLKNFDLFAQSEPLTLQANLEIKFDALLTGLEYADCPEFEEWLLLQRAVLESKQLGQLELEVLKSQEAGDHQNALKLAREWLQLEPFSEEALRHVMRLQVAQNELAAARVSYQTFTARLSQEWGFTPSAVTQQLALELEQQALQDAAKVLIGFAQNAEDQLQFETAATHWQAAAEKLEGIDRHQAFQTWQKAHRLRLEFPDANLEFVTNQIERLAQAPNDLALAALARAQTAFAVNDFVLAARAARMGLKQTLDAHLQAQLENELASALLRLDQVPEALEAHARALALLENSSDLSLKASTLAELALARANADQHKAAQQDFLEADRLYTVLERPRERITILGNLAMSQRMQGMSEAALETLMLAQTIVSGASGVLDEARYLFANRGEILCWREEYNAALADLLQAKRLSEQQDLPMSFVWFRLAHIYQRLGASELALEALTRAEQSPGVLNRGQAMAAIIRARVKRQQGLDARAELQHAEQLLAGQSTYSHNLRLSLERLEFEPDLSVAQKTLADIQNLELHALKPVAYLRMAQVSRDSTDALKAWNLLERITPIDITRAEITATCFDLGADLKYQQPLTHIPLEFRESFQKLPWQQRLQPLTLQ